MVNKTKQRNKQSLHKCRSTDYPDIGVMEQWLKIIMINMFKIDKKLQSVLRELPRYELEVERALGTLDATHKVPRNPGLPREEH